ncbi:MAG: helix-turn-helix domain-containing protein [Phycisphaerae bacterium]|nr:helix-turn-helix domain-containing protein [Phycisphaerae bacterium]
MQKRKDVLTTGQVAQICNVAPRTVTKWFDSGQLKGYRIPGSKDRRIPTNELVRFMKAHDIPTDELEIGQMRILIIDTDWEYSERMAEYFQEKKNYQVHTASNSFDAGLLAQKIIPHIIMINLMAQDIDAGQVCKYIRSNPELEGGKVIAIAENLGENEAAALIGKGFDEVLTDPDNFEEAAAMLQQLSAIIY